MACQSTKKSRRAAHIVTVMLCGGERFLKQLCLLVVELRGLRCIYSELHEDQSVVIVPLCVCVCTVHKLAHKLTCVRIRSHFLFLRLFHSPQLMFCQ